jgi:hypothetical protein
VCIRCNIEKIESAKKRAGLQLIASQLGCSQPYVNLVAIVVFVMTVMAIIAVSIVVCSARIVTVVCIRPVVTIWIITGAVWIVAGAVWIVTVSVTRIAKSDPNSPHANCNLSV